MLKYTTYYGTTYTTQNITHMMKTYICLVDEWGLEDFGASGMTFEVQSLYKGKEYEMNEDGYIVDDNGCSLRPTSDKFINKSDTRDRKIGEIINA